MQKTPKAQTAQPASASQAPATTVAPLDVAVRIHSIKPDGTMRARCSLVFGASFAVHGVKLMDGANGYFLSMPSYKVNSGVAGREGPLGGKAGDDYKQICHPITKEFRQELLDIVLREYEQSLAQTQLASQRTPVQHTQPEAREAPDFNAGQSM